MKTSKKINAGDTLTVGDLTDDYIGASIEVGPTDGGITFRFRLDLIECYGTSQVKMLTTEGGAKHADLGERVRVITPPPVVQPDEPTILGQCIRIEGDDEWRAVVADPDDDDAPIRGTDGSWLIWDLILEDAGNRQIIVSDPPRWPDETPEVPECIEQGEWPDDDTHLRAWEWIERDDYPWWWNAQLGLWESEYMTSDMRRQLFGPLTRGERIK